MPGRRPACSASRPPTAGRASAARSGSSRRHSMSQHDLQGELRRARPVAPEELRERVRLIADRAPQTQRRLSWRLGAALAFAAAIAVAAAVVAVRGRDEHPAAEATVTVADQAVRAPSKSTQPPEAAGGAQAAGGAGATALVPRAGSVTSAP